MGNPRRPHHDVPQRRYGDAAERRIAKRGYTTTVASGSKAEKGDLRRAGFRIEVKATRADSFRVSRELMSKLRNDGLTDGKQGVMIVRLGDGTEYAVMPVSIFEDLTGAD